MGKRRKEKIRFTGMKMSSEKRTSAKEEPETSSKNEVRSEPEKEEELELSTAVAAEDSAEFPFKKQVTLLKKPPESAMAESSSLEKSRSSSTIQSKALLRYNWNCYVECSCTNPNNLTKTIQTSEDNTSKAELMDALLHSQTRAREAEIAAKRAYEEKEHVVELFFRQASQLFAYKQWFQLLQLERLQIKNKDHPMSTLFPLVLPWMSYKNMVSQKRRRRFSKQKRVAVAFVLGLSLVSAGLLLGWTVGWMLPSF